MDNSKQEGVIKYDRSQFIPAAPLPVSEYHTLAHWRKRLRDLGLIGVYPDGVGYGNLSCRKDYSNIFSSSHPQFLITGSQTGHLEELTGEHFSRVLDFDIPAMKVLSMGVVEASSETLTHAAIYQANPRITAVAHGHHRRLWQRMIELNYPSTSDSLAYGTDLLAHAVGEIARDRNEGLLVMKGHVDGMICFASSFDKLGVMLDATMKCLVEELSARRNDNLTKNSDLLAKDVKSSPPTLA